MRVRCVAHPKFGCARGHAVRCVCRHDGAAPGLTASSIGREGAELVGAHVAVAVQQVAVNWRWLLPSRMTVVRLQESQSAWVVGLVVGFEQIV